MSKSYFDDFKGKTDDWLYEHFSNLLVKYDGNIVAPELPYNQRVDGITHDYWNAYAYGNEIKFVYVKIGTIHRKKNISVDKKTTVPKMGLSDDEKKKRFSQSVSRARNRVFELAVCNEFQYFCTFTQDEKKRDRFDLKTFRKDFAQMVRNLNRKRPPDKKIKYLLIPETHQNGAWHMHGLLQGLSVDDLREFDLNEKIPKKIKNTIKSGQKVYDWTTYRRKFGYFTCTEIDNITACAKYITKYITKSLDGNNFDDSAHLFFASQGLKGREEIVRNCFEPCPIDEWDFQNEYVKIKTIKI